MCPVKDILLNMVYLEVLIASSSYHGSELLTYSHDQVLPKGTIVLVPMRSKRVSAIVIGSVPKPRFVAKPIIGIQVTSALPPQTLKLLKWLGDYYPSPSGSVVSQFLPSNLLLKNAHQEPTKLATGNPSPEALPPLTAGQTKAIKEITATSDGSVLLQGDTGTGKTRIYIDLALDSLKNGRDVVILTPEIGLTSQLADSFKQHLKAPVLIIHSNLTGQERRDLWMQILFAKQPLVVIGPRSALFSPYRSVGLVVVDEAHDNSYKQDQAPRYNALRVASKLSALHGAKLVYGTATPLISEHYYAEVKKVPIVRLTEQAIGNKTPPVIEVVNARDRQNYAKNPYLSNQLIEAVAASLELNEQALVFLNRRGTARLVICQNCDWHAICPNCALPLTYHGDSHIMRCHTCGFKTNAVTSCPVCNSPDVVFKSIGTKAIAASLASLFPGATVQRFDTDNLKEERFEKQYQAVRRGEVDILVGTQMLVKGLDLPRLGMVGVVAADSSLYFPDFTAEEQTYQLLTQVIGRVGRGHTESSSVVIQTYDPNGRSLQAAITKDWQGFYKSQLEERKEHHYPPFYYMLKLYCSRKSQAAAVKSATNLKVLLLEAQLPIELTGPAPRFIEQSNGQYSWQLIVKSKQRSVLTDVVQMLPANWSHDIDPLNLL